MRVVRGPDSPTSCWPMRSTGRRKDAERCWSHAGASGDASRRNTGAAAPVHGARDAESARDRGHYPLPEAQLDRFLLKIDHANSVAKRRSRHRRATTTDQTGDALPLSDVTPRADERAVLALQHPAARQRVDTGGGRLCGADSASHPRLAGIAVGSARGADRTGAAREGAAAAASRSFVLPEDVKAVAVPALRHRIALSADAQLDGRRPDDVTGRRFWKPRLPPFMT